MNYLLFAFWFLQELKKKKNEMESEEEKKMEDARWKANRIVTMATINIQMVAMDSLVFRSCVLFPAKIWSNWRISHKRSRFWGHIIKKEQYLNSYSKLFFWVETLKKHLEKQNLKGKIKCPGHLIMTQADPITTSPPVP